jgi:DNA helicase-2/ATP-dependent DNA helicase PcrA
MHELIVAAAGSGKTTRIVNEAKEIKIGEVLITTYTDANFEEIKKSSLKLTAVFQPMYA